MAFDWKKYILMNGIWLTFPAMIWNIIFAGRLPAQFLPEIFLIQLGGHELSAWSCCRWLVSRESRASHTVAGFERMQRRQVGQFAIFRRLDVGKCDLVPGVD